MSRSKNPAGAPPAPTLAARRDFLRRSAAAASTLAAPMFVSSQVLGGAGMPGANDRVTLGFIGCGRQTVGKNIPLFLRTPGVVPLAVCDVDRWRMGEAIKQMDRQYASGRAKGTLGPVDRYGDYEDLLAREDIDAVCIGTPDHWHHKMAIDAMRAGKDVALEKPIARSIADSRSFINAAKAHARVFRVDTEFRSGRGPHRAAWLVRNGYVGQPRHVEVIVPIADRFCAPQPEMAVPEELDYRRWLGDAPAAPYTEKRVHPRKSFARPGWFSLLDYADGVVTNWGAHLNSGAMWATDKELAGPIEVSGTGTYLPRESFYDVLSEFRIDYRFADGLTWSYRTGAGARFRVVGDEGWVQAGFGDEFDASSPALATLEPGAGDLELPRISEKQDFINCVRSRGPTMESPEIGHRINTLGKLGHIAAHLGRPLRWNPDLEQFDNDAEATRFVREQITRRP